MRSDGGRSSVRSNLSVSRDESPTKRVGKPIIENLMLKRNQEIIKFDVIKNLTTVSSGSQHSFVLRIPSNVYKAAASAFWSYQPYYVHFMRQFIPQLTTKMYAKQQKILRLFKEVDFTPGAIICTEG